MTQRHFIHPHPTVTPKQRKRLLILIIMAAIIIVLVWILSLPFNYSDNSRTNNSKTLTGEMRNTFSTGKKALSTYFRGNKND